MGGLHQLEPEARRIVWATLRTYPVEILQIAMTNTGHQLLRFGIGEGLSPGSLRLVALYIGEVFGPEVEKSLLRSRQADDRLPLAEFRQLHLIGLLFSLVIALWSLIAGRQCMPARLAALYVFAPVGILWNAVVTGSLSGPFDRYLARVVWVTCFVALVGFFYVAQFRSKAAD